MRHTPRTPQAFTLVELLVVIAIIVTLLSILMPSMGRAIAVAEDTKCRTQLRSIGQAFLEFAADHRGTIPGVYYTHYPEAWTHSWMGKEVWPAVSTYGTILPYMGGESNVVQNQLYRCPSLPAGTVGSGVGSNGSFDYASMHSLSGARISGLPATAEVIDSITGASRQVGVPIVLEEDPAATINAGSREPGHAGGDRLGSWHYNNGGNFASIDGSVTQFNASQPGLGPRPDTDWFALAPSGNIVSLQHTGSAMRFGEWNGR